MSRMLGGLLAADDLARRFGAAPNPRLRAAIEADRGFPARSAGPAGSADAAAVADAENVVALAEHLHGGARVDAATAPISSAWFCRRVSCMAGPVRDPG